MTNTLPLTQVSVQKQWEDSNNTYRLRPESISVHLERIPVDSEGEIITGNTWTGLNATPTETANGDNNWTLTFSGLPRYDEYNHKYKYRVVEDKVNAYDTTYENNSTTPTEKTDTDQTANDINGEVSFSIKNKLITAPITLVKVWNDKGCTQAGLHYPVTFTVNKPSTLTNDDFSFTALTPELDGTKTDTTVGIDNGNETWSKSETLPVYDKNGDPIQYVVTETSDQHYGYTVSSNVTTQNGSHTGYTSKYYNTYTITNELPVTSVKAVKHWEGEELERYKHGNVTVNLTRTPESNTENPFSQSKEIALNSNVSGDDYVEFQNLLVKDYDGNDYTYTINEQLVRGYSTTYQVNRTEGQSVPATGSTIDERTVTIINEPIKGEASLVKYDATDYEKHNGETNFSLVTLENAKFELHKQDGTVLKVTGANGNYTLVPDNTAGATTEISSGSGGVINISKLEPNVYYLQETDAPAGYQLDTATKYYFTVYVDEQNHIRTIYNGKTYSSSESTGTEIKEVKKNSSNEKVQGIPNEENMSELTLTKVDERDQTITLPNAYYYLLRLVNFEYRKTTDADETTYLKNALAVLDGNFDVDNNLYWEKVGEDNYVTDSNGKITVDGHMFGTYVFYEVKSPTGYERNSTYKKDSVINEKNADYLGPVKFDSTNATHGEEVHNLTHLEPRKNANIKILKTDENGNPLNGATFDLYQSVTGGDDVKIATVTTGYDGMNATVTKSDDSVTSISIKDNKTIVIDTSEYDWNTKFYFMETTPPKGYSADNDETNQNKIEFTLTPELADETLHIVRANDSRLKGKVTLTKISSQATTLKPAGTALGGAEFQLYQKNDTQLKVYARNPDDSNYFVYSGNDSTVVTNAGYDSTNKITDMTTGTDGKIHIEGIEWGDYYLKEITPPTGYVLPDDENARKVVFSVGRNTVGKDENNQDIIQELTMKNDPETASLNIIKHIDEMNANAWGNPTFIFKIRQTAYYDAVNNSFVAMTDNQPILTKTITVQTSVSGGYENATGIFDIEPGTYEITEVRVARYEADENPVITGNSADSVIPITSSDNDIAKFSIKPNGTAEVKFKNKLNNYEKLSHNDIVTNEFNGYKALKVSDKDGLKLNTPVSDSDSLYSVTISKSDLSPALVLSDGTSKSITDTADLKKLVISSTDSEITVNDNSDGNSIIVTGRKEDVSGSVYKMTAVYDNFTTNFELRFVSDPLFTKKEVTVIFKNDTENKSYFGDGDNIYTLNVIMNVTDTGTNITKILHDGISTATTDETAFPTPNIHAMFANQVEFDKWSYTGDDSEELLDIIKNASDGAEITVTAKLILFL